MTGASPLRVWGTAAVALLLFFFFAPVRARDGRTFQIDEVAKISETHFLRLFARGDFHSPEWFRNIIDRTNLAGGKYIFGLAIVAHGLPLPPAPSLGAATPAGDIPAIFPREVNARYKQYLVPARRAGLLAASLAAALIVAFALRMHGPVAAIAAVSFFTFHEITLGFGGNVARDTLMAGALCAAAAPVWTLWQNPRGRRWLVHALVAGVLCGIAISIRFNGAVALVFAVTALLVRRAWRAALVVALVASALVLAMHPYYWADAPTGVPDEFRTEEVLPLRVVHRLGFQLRDMQKVVALLPPHIELRTPLQRLRFLGMGIVNGAVGMALWLAVALGVALPVFRRRTTDAIRFVWLWALIVAGIAALLQPVAWQRYLIAVLPPLALLGGIGVGELVALARNRRTR